MPKKVYVGMSGGVDSSVTAALLLKQGFDVTGVYMKNWSRDMPGFICPWKEDYLDAKRVAVQLGIKFKMYDFEAEYRHLVVDYMLQGYQAGITPNPDIMCNQEIKFKLFLNTCLADGADMIATGHYARIVNYLDVDQLHKPALYSGLDKNKDQSYFLYRVTSESLKSCLMPLGELKKTEVRNMARKLGLSTAEKKDSQGICFVGKVGIKEFLLAELGNQPPGPIINQHGQQLGYHDGALFYTVGQRHGLDIGGGLPYYVVGKNMNKNEVYVTTDLQDNRLWRREVVLGAIHWIGDNPFKESTLAKKTSSRHNLKVRMRYRADLVNCRIEMSGQKCTLLLSEDVRAITVGQSAVIYDDDRVLGGGIVI